MNEVFVTDNLLPEEQLSIIQKHLLNNDYFPWYYQDYKVYKNNDPKKVNKLISPLYNYQFTHAFFDDYRPLSTFFDLLQPFLDLIKPISIVRIKANLTLAAPSVMEYDFHTDLTTADHYTDLKTALFYVNTNDGYTAFEGGKKIESIENRFVYFKSFLKHTGTTTTDKKRVVINFNYF